MRKYLYVISALFLVSLQSYAAGEIPSDPALEAPAHAIAPHEESFLDGYLSIDPETITPATFNYFIAPFSGPFLNVGEAEEALTLIKRNPSILSDKPIWEGQKAKNIDTLRSPKVPCIIAASNPSMELSLTNHMLSPRDIRIAEYLYYVFRDKVPDKDAPGGERKAFRTYWEIESIVWGVMTPKIKISPNPSKVSARDLAAMDLWVFLISVKQGAWPYDPPVARLVRPSPEHTTCEGNLEFLSNMFKGLLDSYRVAQD